MRAQSPGTEFERDSSGRGLLRLAVLETKDGTEMECSNKRVTNLINRGFWPDMEWWWGRRGSGRSGQGPEDLDEIEQVK